MTSDILPSIRFTATGRVWVCLAAVQAYVQAGYTKIHLDASMRLGDDDPSQSLDLELIARRTAQLALAAYTALPEAAPASSLRYVIGSEVPIPGGALEHEEGVRVTEVKDVQQMLEATRQAFFTQGLEAAWEQVIAAVVQPGVEFGDDFILKYEPEAAHELSHYIESTPYIYEAHSTDYQPQDCLRDLVRDHFAILKVGPALTYAFREAVFALAQVEDQLVPALERSRLVEVLDEVMLKKPEYWVKHYHGTEQELAHARKYSLSDRIRYYWAEPEVQAGFDRLLANLGHKHLPRELIEQYLPMTASIIQQRKLDYLAQVILIESVSTILRQYRQACEPLQY
jgi:D-tagatose-1,6-bisphosphate aldolase subunit GatZ/KbaZ